MWKYASELDSAIDFLSDLDEEQYEQCLWKVQRYMESHKAREGKKYECGAGVRSVEDRAGGGCFGTARERYNGIGGGRVFKWYSGPVFNKILAHMGVSEASCNERQCMNALAAVSREVMKYPMVSTRLKAYAGPQCYPHVDSSSPDYRVHANEQRDEVDEGKGGAQASCRAESCIAGGVLEERCWMQCARCAKWRRVDPGSVEALRSNNFFDVLPTDLDWEAWLSGAGQRLARAQSFVTDKVDEDTVGVELSLIHI
mgnify:FL=1